MNSERPFQLNRTALWAVLLATLGGLQAVQAEPTIVSTVPADGETDVSTTTTVAFTFSEAMNPEATAAFFYDDAMPIPNIFPTTPSWSVGNTVLTCTPLSAFPANTMINWLVSGQNPGGDPIGGFPFGFFTTGAGGGGGGGNGTNATTTFSVGKVHHYQQTSAGAPALDPLTPYGFAGVTSLASNRTAISVTLTNPVGDFFDLFHLPPPSAEIFILASNFTSLATFDATFPAGNYGFIVQTQALDQIVVVALPTTNSMPQPNAPHLTNYVAAQAVNPSQPFVLGWDAFTGGTTADYIDVDVDGAINSPEPGQPGWLCGTARTFTIPAGMLQPNTPYAARIGFFRHAGLTNASYTTAAYRATYTEFALVTTGSATSALVLTNATYSPANFSFNVLCSTGQDVTVEYKTNLSSVSWLKLLTTNSLASPFRAVSPQAATNRTMYFRARYGL